ncbi:MAG TPA: Do family serine endopeptidase [Candidatus Polarisedimenticolia bacterium]|nr:Do family serine endopeptidase [Candidatus Polarisedimenticolia bacterium]
MTLMKKNSQLITLATIAAACVIFGMVLAGGLNLTRPGRAEGAVDRPLHAAAVAQRAAIQGAPSMIPASFADIAERVNPAVVSITSTEAVKSSGRGRQQPFHGDPFEFFFGPGPQRRLPQQQEEEPHFEQSGGSGFLIGDDGFILTNYHVVEDATKIKVNLSGDRRDYPADVVGTDPGTDLALIRIKVDKRLPALSLGDSDAMRVGDWVIAVGNPLNYEHTVTVGVVSAKGRHLPQLSRDFSLDNFIQTDAAINFGNSGGPLVNLAGEVIGVNTAISSVGQGIGFAVPINVARDIMEQLKSKGKVSRGYLGISLGEITPDLQEAFGLKTDKGALVQSIQPGLPADEAGLKRGDVIVAVDGHSIESTNEVVRMVSAKEPGSTVRLTVNRGGKEMTLNAKLAERPLLGRGQEPGARPGEPSEEPNEKMLGISVDDLTPQILQELDLPKETAGVVVTRVSKVSQAYEKNLGEGDVITELNRAPIKSVADYRRELHKVKEGGLVVFYVITPPSRTQSDAVSRYVTVRLQSND